MENRVYFKLILIVFVLFLFGTACFAQGQGEEDGLQMRIVIPATQVFNGAILIKGRAYACTESSLLWQGSRTMEGRLTDEQYEELIELIERSNFFDMSRSVDRVLYSDNERYIISIRFQGRQNEIDFCPEDNKLYEMVEKVIEITSFIQKRNHGLV